MIQIGPNCLAGNIKHEIGHTVGLYHEHSRPDRDDRIIIYDGFDEKTNKKIADNIIDNTKHNFTIIEKARITE